MSLKCEDLCRAAGVCKLWRQVASSDECWDALLRRLPISNFIVNEPPSLRRQNGSRRVASRLRYLLYRSRSGKWDDHEDFRDRFVVDSTYLPQAASPLKLVAFEDKRESVVVFSTGQKAFLCFFHLMHLNDPSQLHHSSSSWFLAALGWMQSTSATRL